MKFAGPSGIGCSKEKVKRIVSVSDVYFSIAGQKKGTKVTWLKDRGGATISASWISR